MPELLKQLNDAHSLLLQIHKALIDWERRRYEKTHGRVESPYTLLQLLINDPQFAWLRPMSELIVQIDEFTESKEPRTPEEAQAILTQFRTLLTPNESGTPFQQNYHRALQENPDLALLRATLPS